MTEKIKVLVVDDSAFMRSAISNMIDSDPDLKVIGTAKDGRDCIEKIEQLKPDIVTLDIEMPVMDGIEALKIIMSKMPLPVLILSSLTVDGANATLEALEIGALDFIPKNLDNLSLNIMYLKDDLIKKIKVALKKRVTPIGEGEKQVEISKKSSLITKKDREIVAIGSSTGGPKALKEVLIQLPENISAGVVIVQHMPVVFIKQFVARLNQTCKIDIKEAEDGETIKKGQVLVAPGGVHTTVVKKGGNRPTIALVEEPSDVSHRPSVDMMMCSVANAYSSRALGVIMTGMGNDGMKGMTAIKEGKGFTIAQDEGSCVVYGMPKSAVDAGVVDKIVPLSDITREIMSNI